MELFGSPWAQLGAVGLVGVFVLAILTGRLVARSSVRDLLEQAQLRVALAERTTDRWQAAAEASARAAEASDRRADLHAEQMGEILAVMRSVQELIRVPRSAA